MLAHAGTEAVRLVPFSSLLLSETLALSSGGAFGAFRSSAPLEREVAALATGDVDKRLLS